MRLSALLIAACASTAIPRTSERKPSIEDPPAELTAKSSDTEGHGCGPELSTIQYKAQCSDGSFAMVCLKADTTHKRCACQRGGRYFWADGYYCNGRLACYSRPCR